VITALTLLLCGLSSRLLLRWRRSDPGNAESVCLWLMGFFGRYWHRCTRLGPELLPSQGAALVLANHPSHADPAFLLACSSRLLHFLQAAECYEVFLLRRLFQWVGCIPVRRGQADVRAMRQALQQLKQGQVLCVFPEGEVWTNPDAEELGRGKSGAALLALRSRVPVYPIWIENAPRTRRLVLAWLWPARQVQVIPGPAVDLSEYYHRPLTHALLDEVTEHLMRSIAALRPVREPQAAVRPVAARSCVTQVSAATTP
jgi:1-acyl-sn-glycerol-3-phosphate acyltransferase